MGFVHADSLARPRVIQGVPCRRHFCTSTLPWAACGRSRPIAGRSRWPSLRRASTTSCSIRSTPKAPTHAWVYIIRTVDTVSEHGPSLVPKDPKLAAEVDVFEDWADESLYWHGFRAKFVDDEGWSRLGAAMAELLPAKFLGVVVLPMIRRDLWKKIGAQGLTRRSPERMDEELDRHLDSLETRLSDRDYLVGDSLTIADLSVTAMVGQLTVGLTPPFARRIAERRRLSAFLARVFAQTAPPLG